MRESTCRSRSVDRGEWVGLAFLVHQPGDELGVDDAVAVGDASHVAGEGGQVGHSVFEEVADAAVEVGDETHGVVGVDVLGEQEQPDVDVGPSDLDGGVEAFGGVTGRHADVDDGGVGWIAIDEAEQLDSVTGLADDLESGLGQDASHPFAEQHGVVGEDHAHGIAATSRVPPPAGLSTVSRPLSVASRSTSPCRPLPFLPSAPPRPLSITSIHSSPSARRPRTVMLDASACLTAFVMASLTTK